MNQSKFKTDPYNPSNALISVQDVIHIMKQVNMNDFKPTHISFYQESFIHKSYNFLSDYKEFTKPDDCLELQKKSYETLEFLGDSLLGCMTAEYLYKRFEGEDEGFFTKIKTRIVNGEQLCYLANKLGLNKHLIISKHIEENCSGRENQHILEDVLEAFIGALYLDTQDYTVIQEFVFNLIEEFLDLPEIILKDTNFKDQILRYFQHNFKVHPKYETIKSEYNNFECKIFRKEENENIYICSGTGNTKKKAEQNSSRNALIQYRVMSE